MRNELVEFLKEKGLSGRSLAKELGLSVSYVSLILKGSRPVTYYFATAVADCFGLDLLETLRMAGLLKKGADLSEDAQAGPKVTMDSVAQVDSVVINGGGE